MRPRGVSLPEVVVSTFVLGVVGLVLVTVSVSASRFTRDEQNRIDVDLSANRVLTVMDEHLRQGKQVLASYTDGVTTYTTSATTLVLSLPSLLSSGTLSSTDVDTAVFFLNGSTLNLLIDASTSSTRTDRTQPVTDNVQDLYFRYAAPVPTDATALTATVRTQRSLLNQTYTQTSLLYGNLRNHP